MDGGSNIFWLQYFLRIVSIVKSFSNTFILRKKNSLMTMS